MPKADYRNNLKDLADRPKEERSRIASMGGKAAGAAKRKKRDIRILAKELLDMGVNPTQKTMRKRMADLGYAEEDMVYANAILTAMVIKASNGDVNAAKFVRDTAGYVPEENVSVNAAVSEKSDVLIYLPEQEKDDDDEGSNVDAE